MAGRKQLTPFCIGQIAALHREGYSQSEISDAVTRPDGEPVPRRTVGRVVQRLEQDASWEGERAEGSGRPRETTAAQDAAMARAVMRMRGKRRAHAAVVKRSVKSLRGKSTRLVQRRLREKGLKWLRRRRKTWVPEHSRARRLEWASWVMRQRQTFLNRWVYVDGASFFLDRSEQEHGESTRAALGPYVWRMAEHRDALFADCVGPSSYAKGQGELVRVWGMLSQGRLHTAVLPRGTALNRWVYERMILQTFKKWLTRSRRPLLVQDYERCLWCAEPQAALRKIGVQVIRQHPKHSPDLNAIENVWSLLRARLNVTRPSTREGRPSFLRRLRAAVSYINKHYRRTLLKYARNQKKRAREVQAQQGHRTQW